MGKNKEKKETQRLETVSLSFDDYSSDNINFGYSSPTYTMQGAGELRTSLGTASITTKINAVEPLKTLTISDPEVKISYSGIDYKYNEGKLLEEIRQYINSTYGEHYSQNKYQATEFIIDGGHGVGFTIGNIMKYAQRYGNKGDHKEWRKDLMKVVHYAIIAMYNHDLEHKG